MDLKIHAKLRTVFGKANKKLRLTGSVPAVVYGPGKETLPLLLDGKEFEKVFRQSGESTLVDLVIDGEPRQKKILIHDVAKHFMKDEPIHVDFYEVDLNRKIHAKIPVHISGTAPAVKELGGVLVKNMSEIEVEALPADLPQFIEVNLAGLKTFDDHIRFSDLKVSDKVKVLSRPEDLIISVQKPRSEEELKELEKPAAEAEQAAIEAMAKKEEAEKAVAKDGEEEIKPKAEPKTEN